METGSRGCLRSNAMNRRRIALHPWLGRPERHRHGTALPGAAAGRRLPVRLLDKRGARRLRGRARRLAWRAGVWRLYLGYARSAGLRSLQVAPEELGATEKVLKQTRGSIVHYRNGSPWRFWDAIGGKLFLTSSRQSISSERTLQVSQRYECEVIPLAEVIASVGAVARSGLPTGLARRVTSEAPQTNSFGVGVRRMRTNGRRPSASCAASGRWLKAAATIV